MLTLSQQEHDRTYQYLDQLSRSGTIDPIREHSCIYRSHDFPETRLVLKLETQGAMYALKADTQAPITDRLRKEYNLLCQLAEYFDDKKTSQVVRPIYLSYAGDFMVTEYIKRPTAVDLIYNSPDNDQVAQVYRRAGAWLNDLHGFRPAKDYAFRPKWMTDSIRDLSENLPANLGGTSQRMINTMLAEAARLKGTPDIQVFAHGDFHGLNLIMGQGKTIGLDFTEAREKLAVYDIVDFLKADIFRDSQPSDVDRSGILKRNKDMFFRLYRHPINMDILDFCIRGRLLKDWLFLSQPSHVCSEFEDHRRTRLEIRLKQAFNLPRSSG